MSHPGINDLYNRKGRQEQPVGPEDKSVEEPGMEEMPEDQITFENTAENAAEEGASQPVEKSVEKPERDVDAEINEMRLRMAAEMDNFKKRLQRDYDEQKRFAAEKVLADLLPALDNLDLALQYGSTHEACKDMMQGIEMTRKQLLDAVSKSGLVSVGAVGENFDPAIHEAIGMEPNPDLEQGAVSKVLQSGYKLGDRLLRPAKVFVNN